MKTNKDNTIKKIINIVLDILIGLLGIILLVTIYKNIQIKLLGNDYSSFFGHSLFEVQTGSMANAINAGDWIIVKDKDDIKLNDIITFKQNDQFITHRVIETYNGTYVTKGDANNAKDSPISQSQIVGKVVKVLPHFGILRKTLFNPFVLIALIITIYLVNSLAKKPSPLEIEKENKMINTLREKLNELKNKVLDIINKQTQIDSTKNIEEEPKKEKEEIEKVEEEVVTQEELKEIKEEIVIDDPEIEEEIQEEKSNENQQENLENTQDMDKTVFFRMVSVDENDIEGVYNKTPIEETSELAPLVKETEEETDEEMTEDKVKTKLELIQKKKKKCKNFIEKTMYLKEEELEEIITILNKDEKLKPNEPTIKDEYLKAYIDAKYYNNCGDINLEYTGRNMIVKIEKFLEEYETKITKEYKGTDVKYQEKVNKFSNFMKLVNHLEEDYETIEDNEQRKDKYNKRILKYIKFNDLSAQDIKLMINKIIKVQKTYTSMIKFLLNKLDTGMFQLNMTKIGKSEIYAVDLQHNIAFSKVYSDYIVDKTYKEGIIAEDKIEILASLLLSQIVKTMLNKDFKKKYIIYIPETLYQKETKLLKIFKLFNDEYAKNCITVLIDLKEFTNNKKVISKLIKDGYKFSTDVTSIEGMRKKDQINLHLFENIFVSKKQASKTNIIDILPEEVKSKVVYEEVADVLKNS